MGDVDEAADAGRPGMPGRGGDFHPGAAMTRPEQGRERRHQARTRMRLRVRFGTGDLDQMGYSQDISTRGLSLQAELRYTPGTVLLLEIDYPDGALTKRGIIRWSRETMGTFRQNLRCGMGIEFLETARAERGSEAAQAPAPPPRRRKGAPPDMSDEDLARWPTRRRQVSTLSGNTFEVQETDHRGAIYVRIFQLPLTDGSHEAAFREAFWTREEAEAALRAFLKER